MSLSYEEALSTLQSMFGETWSKESLDAILRHFEGHMENTIEAILNHGRKEPEALIAKLKNFTNLDEDLARQLEAQEHQQTSTTNSSATMKKGLGTPTRLPPEFLRIPGYSLPSTVAADEQLARMLQDEIFQRELANSREFGHLARNPSRTNYPGAAAAAASTSDGPNIMEKLAGKTNITAFAWLQMRISTFQIVAHCYFSSVVSICFMVKCT
jgi:hypothetical protein